MSYTHKGIDAKGMCLPHSYHSTAAPPNTRPPMQHAVDQNTDHNLHVNQITTGHNTQHAFLHDCSKCPSSSAHTGPSPSQAAGCTHIWCSNLRWQLAHARVGSYVRSGRTVAARHPTAACCHPECGPSFRLTPSTIRLVWFARSRLTARRQQLAANTRRACEWVHSIRRRPDTCFWPGAEQVALCSFRAVGAKQGRQGSAGREEWVTVMLVGGVLAGGVVRSLLGGCLGHRNWH
jgi:hypothetical protein